VYNWRLQGIPPAALRMITERFADNVRIASQGQINITVFSVGELVPAPEMLHAVAEGTIEMALTFPAIHSSEVTLGAISSGIPWGWSNMTEQLCLFEFFEDARMQELMREEFAEHGAYFLGQDYADPMSLIANKPIRTLDELRALNIEAVTEGIAVWLDELGVSTVAISPEEIYTAIATGTVDGATFGGASYYHDIGITEVAKYYHLPHIVSPCAAAYIVNLDVWNSLPDNLKDALRVARADAVMWTHSMFNTFEAEARGASGVEIVYFGDELQATMASAALKVWDKIAARSPECAEGIELLKSFNRQLGRID